MTGKARAAMAPSRLESVGEAGPQGPSEATPPRVLISFLRSALCPQDVTLYRDKAPFVKGKGPNLGLAQRLNEGGQGRQFRTRELCGARREYAARTCVAPARGTERPDLEVEEFRARTPHSLAPETQGRKTVSQRLVLLEVCLVAQGRGGMTTDPPLGRAGAGGPVDREDPAPRQSHLKLVSVQAD